MSASATEFVDDDDRFFAVVAKELSLGRKDDALWIKAFALESGDGDKTKAHYIRLRVEKLRHIVKLADEKEHNERQGGRVREPIVAIRQDEGALDKTSDTNTSNDDRTVELPTVYDAAIGKSSHYYTVKFEQIASSGNSISWNWCAFFFTIPWALYRKMWGVAALGMLVGSIISGILQTHMPVLDAVLHLALMVAFGAFGNYWYYGKINRLIKTKSAGRAPNTLSLAKIKKHGGTTQIPFYLIVALVVVPLLFGWAISLKAPSPTGQSRTADDSVSVSTQVKPEHVGKSWWEDDPEVPASSNATTKEPEHVGKPWEEYSKTSASSNATTREPDPAWTPTATTGEPFDDKESVTKQQTISDTDNFWNAIDAAVPDFDQINKDPRWFKYLDTKMPGAQMTRRTVAKVAIEKYDSATLIALLQNWKRSVAQGDSTPRIVINGTEEARQLQQLLGNYPTGSSR